MAESNNESNDNEPMGRGPRSKVPHYGLLWVLAGLTALILGIVVLRHPALLAGGDAAALDRETLNARVHEYIVNNPQVIQEAAQTLQRREQAQREENARPRIAANREAIFFGDDALVTGNPDAKVNVAEFFDYNCPYCKRSHDTVAQLRESGDVRLVHKQFPVLANRAPGSRVAAKAALAAARQGMYLPLHNAMMEHSDTVTEAVVMTLAEKVGLDMERLKSDMQDPEIEKRLQETMELASRIGVDGTPTFIVEDRLISGAKLEELKQAVAEAAKAPSDS